MHLDPPTQEGAARPRLRGLLVWGGLTVLAALALALVIASLALELGSEPALAPPLPIQFSPPGGGHPRPQ
jgi:hypothetical protein